MLSTTSTTVRSLILALFLLLPAIATTSAQSTGTVDVRIWTESSDGSAVYDVCYELAGYSNVGCDENRDGNVLFEDIPYGDYDVQPVYPNGSQSSVDPFHITVSANSSDFVARTIGAADPASTTNVFLVTRDPETGESLTDACYEFVGYSNIGCDENKDGRILFQDIPYSSIYTIRQTTTPAGYPKMDDYYVSVLRGGDNLPLTILLSQSKQQAPEGKNNVSVVFFDAWNGKPVGDAENCAQLRKGREAVSNIGCDEEVIDGQVDFLHVDWQPNDANYSLRATPMCGYDIVQQNDLDIFLLGQNSIIIYVPLEPNGANCS